MNVRVSFALDYYEPSCLPPKFMKCADRGLKLFKFFAQGMWPGGVDYIGYPKDKWDDYGQNVTLPEGTLYGDLIRGTVDSDASQYGISDETVQNYDLTIPFTAATLGVYYNRRLNSV